MSTSTSTRRIAIPRVLRHRPTGHLYAQVQWAVGNDTWCGWHGPFETPDVLRQWIRDLAALQVDLEEVSLPALNLPPTLAVLDTPRNHAATMGGS